MKISIVPPLFNKVAFISVPMKSHFIVYKDSEYRDICNTYVVDQTTPILLLTPIDPEKAKDMRQRQPCPPIATLGRWILLPTVAEIFVHLIVGQFEVVVVINAMGTHR